MTFSVVRERLSKPRWRASTECSYFWPLRISRLFHLLIVLLGLSTVWSQVLDSSPISLYVETGIHHSARSVAFSPDGQLLAASSLDRTIKIWDVQSSRELMTLHNDRSEQMALFLLFLPSAKVLVSSNEDGSITVWDLNNQTLVTSLTCSSRSSPIALADSAKYLICADERGGVIRRWNALTFAEEQPVSVLSSASLTSLRLSVDGSLLVGTTQAGLSQIVNTTSRRIVGEFQNAKPFSIATVAFAPKSNKIATAAEIGKDLQMWHWDIGMTANPSRDEMRTVPDFIHSVTFSADERSLAYASENGDVVVLDANTWKELKRLKSYSNRIENAGIIPDSSVLLTQVWYDSKVAFDLKRGEMVDPAIVVNPFSGSEWNTQGSVEGREFVVRNLRDYLRLETKEGQEISTLILRDKEGTWIAVAPDGRFDTNMALERVAGAHWVVSKNMQDPLPLEIFMRDYYEPRLVPRLLSGQEFPKVRPLQNLNRVQPDVRIAFIRPGAARDLAEVTLVVSGSEGQSQQGGKSVTMKTAVYDLRLFRAGQLVGQEPEPKAELEESLKNGVDLTPEQLQDWRDARRVKPLEGRVKLDTKTGKLTRTFVVRLPHGQPGKEIEFTAYAFNEDRVKSETAKATYRVPADLGSVRKRAYVIAMGVNAYENQRWDLHFAANDAKRIQEALSKRLSGYEVVPVTMISDCRTEECPENGDRNIGEDHATKAALHAVLQKLAGHALSEELKKSLPPGAEKVEKAEPDDLVLMFVSSHGYTSKEGTFYMVPSDSGDTEGHTVKSELLQQWVSSDELSGWLRDVDAGDLVMIVDTCHSASTVEEPGFKPGPMGSRGLGQLAYDKGMRILAASQADDVALEVEKLKQGLLTYALVENGLEDGQAAGTEGKITMDGWLQYGVDRVPTLYNEVLAGKVQKFTAHSKDTNIDEELSGGTSSLKKPSAFQQPSFFNFNKSDSGIALVEAVLKNNIFDP